MTRADETLRRLSYIVPAAAREGGVSIDELARTLEVSPERILNDIATAADRDFYHPGGWVSEVVILATAGRLEVDRAGAFARPGKLDAREALCLSLGLRGLGASSFASLEARAELLARADALIAPDTREGDGSGRDPVDSVGGALAIADDEPGADGLDEVVFSCARERRVCRIAYLTRAGAGRRAAVERDIEPRAIARAEGHFYALAWCRLRQEPRAFRFDRIVSAEALAEDFDVPDDFDAGAWIEERRVYQGRDETTVRVRYQPGVARWAREEAEGQGLPVEAEPDGAVTVTYQVAEWDWIVRHALGHGADAEILGPPEVRARARAVLEGMGG